MLCRLCHTEVHCHGRLRRRPLRAAAARYLSAPFSVWKSPRYLSSFSLLLASTSTISGVLFGLATNTWRGAARKGCHNRLSGPLVAYPMQGPAWTQGSVCAVASAGCGICRLCCAGGIPPRRTPQALRHTLPRAVPCNGLDTSPASAGICMMLIMASRASHARYRQQLSSYGLSYVSQAEGAF